MTDEQWILLHAVRVKGLAAAPALAAATGLDHDAVAAAAADLVRAGHLVERTGRLQGWSLSPSGRQLHGSLVGPRLGDGLGAVEAAYRDFLDLNGAMLQLCTEWQLRDGVLNDHSDPDYDAAVVTRLGEIDDAIAPVLARLIDEVPRFAPYAARLAAARRRVDAGEHDWLTKPLMDSYHTVWFELHEDLLVTLGIERANEAAGS